MSSIDLQDILNRITELEERIDGLEATLDEVRLSVAKAYQMADRADAMTRPLGG